MDLVGHDFLTLLDFTPAEIGYLLDLAAELKAKKRAGIPHDTLRGKNVALIFEKTLHPHPLLVRGRRARPWHGHDLSGPHGQPDRQERVHR